MPHTWDPTSPTPEQALRRLVEGNRRFREASGTSSGRPWSGHLATQAQRPFAIVLVLLGVGTLWCGYMFDWLLLRWPVAIVAASDESYAQAKIFAAAAQVRRPLAIFRELQPAVRHRCPERC